MATGIVKQLPKATVELTITIPAKEVKDSYARMFDSVAKEIEIAGFRKGKAPKEIVEKNIDKKKLYQEVIKDIIPKAYSEIIQKEKLQPIIPPTVEVKEAKEGSDWVFTAMVALKPIVKLNKYKEKIQELKKGKVKIWTPGSGDKKEDENKKPSLDELVGVLVDEASVEVSDMIVQQEINRLLSDLLDQTKQLGLTVEQYLAAKGKTTDQLRAEYAAQAQRSVKLEYILVAIADSENITAEKEDIEKLLEKIEKPEEKERLRRESYFLARLIRQQKTLDFLASI